MCCCSSELAASREMNVNSPYSPIAQISTRSSHSHWFLLSFLLLLLPQTHLANEWTKHSQVAHFGLFEVQVDFSLCEKK